MEKRKKICFTSLYSYSLFNQTAQYVFGGSEVRAWLFGVGLSSFKDNEVSFVVFDHGQAKVEHYENVKVYRHSFYKTNKTLLDELQIEVSDCIVRNKGFPFFKIKKKLTWKMPIIFSCFILSKLSRKIKVLFVRPLHIEDYEIDYKKTQIYKDINADIYCSFGVSNFTAEVAAFCKKFGKKFVLFSGSDNDFITKYYEGSSETNIRGGIGYLCYYVIKQADLIITQTKFQSKLLLERFGKHSITVLSPVNLDNTVNEKVKIKNNKYALWIGKSDRVKRPEILLKLANSFKGLKFIMILNRSDSEIHRMIIEKKPDNVKIIDYIPKCKIEKLFLNSIVLINTSVFEGFPNTFLEAGKYGVPILSLKVDPDGFINKNNCGIVASDNFANLVKGLSILTSDQYQVKKLSDNIKKYIYSNHDLNKNVVRLNHVLREINGIED